MEFISKLFDHAIYFVVIVMFLHNIIENAATGKKYSLHKLE